MPNTKHTPGELRLITDEKGIMRLADTDGNPLPVISMTQTTQNTMQARMGYCICIADLFVDTGKGMSASGALKVNEETDEIQLPNGVWYKPKGMAVLHSEDIYQTPCARIACIAYPDPTR